MALKSRRIYISLSPKQWEFVRNKTKEFRTNLLPDTLRIMLYYALLTKQSIDISKIENKDRLQVERVIIPVETIDLIKKFQQINHIDNHAEAIRILVYKAMIIDTEITKLAKKEISNEQINKMLEIEKELV